MIDDDYFRHITEAVDQLVAMRSPDIYVVIYELRSAPHVDDWKKLWVSFVHYEVAKGWFERAKKNQNVRNVRGIFRETIQDEVVNIREEELRNIQV